MSVKGFFTITVDGHVKDMTQMSWRGAGATSERYGVGAVADAVNSVALGNGAQALNTGLSAGANAVVIGKGATATNQRSILIGANAVEDIDTTIGENIGIGTGGVFAANCSANVLIGDSYVAALATVKAVGIGLGVSLKNYSTCVGAETADAFGQSIALGVKATTTTFRQMVIGALGDGSSGPIADVYVGMGVACATPRLYPPGVTIHATSGLGANIAGADLGLAAGQPTGSGAGGDVLVSTAAAGGAGSTLRTLIERLRVTSQGIIAIGAPALPATGSAALILADGTAPGTMGSNTAGLYADDVAGTVNLFAINEANEVTRLSYPAPQTYAASNITPDRTYDALATTLAEIAQVLGTLISDLRARGIVA